MVEKTEYSLLDTEVCTSFEGLAMSVTRFTKIVNECPWVIDAHAHLNFEFHYIYDGVGKILLGTNEFEVKQGQFYICAPFVDHAQVADARQPMKEFCIECMLRVEEQNEKKFHGLEQCAKGMMNEQYEDRCGVLASSFSMLDSLLCEQNLAPESTKWLIVKSHLINCIFNMIEIAQTDNAVLEKTQLRNDINFQRAVAIRNYIEANYKNKISITDCSNIFYMSERQIDRILASVFQETFHSLLMHIRVDVAKFKIKKKEGSMEKIALESGFSGYRQMLRHLKNSGVTTPKELRELSETMEVTDHGSQI